MNWRSVVALLALGLLGGAAGFAWLSSEGGLVWSEPKPTSATAMPEDDIVTEPAAFAPPTIIQPSASQAEAMLLIARARDVIEAGKPMGDLGTRLQTTFGQTQPQALAAIAKGARQPVSNAELLKGFDAIAPMLALPNGTALDRIQYELRTLFVLRSGQTGMKAGAARTERIREMIIAGEIEQATKAVQALPGASFATDWLAKAKTAIIVHRALDALNQAAALPPAPILVPSATAEPDEALVQGTE
ncbi:MAG: hypothetical protein RL481_1891 [Pseudomonadota bacterium]|jgi:hypothetical protein